MLQIFIDLFYSESGFNGPEITIETEPGEFEEVDDFDDNADKIYVEKILERAYDYQPNILPYRVEVVVYDEDEDDEATSLYNIYRNDLLKYYSHNFLVQKYKSIWENSVVYV